MYSIIIIDGYVQQCSRKERIHFSLLFQVGVGECSSFPLTLTWDGIVRGIYLESRPSDSSTRLIRMILQFNQLVEEIIDASMLWETCEISS